MTLENVVSLPDEDRRYRLSKSKIATFEHCPKRLWLQIHRREEGVVDDDTQRVFAIGHKVGELATSLLPDGIMVEAEPDIEAALATTQRLLADNVRVPVFEATFLRDDVLCRVDILEPLNDGSWHVAEVKATTRPKRYQLFDLATQLWIMGGSNVRIARASIRHLRRRFDPDRPGDPQTLFADADVTRFVQPIVAERAAVVDEARSTVRGIEPAIAPGRHCTDPFACEFGAHCSRQASALL